MRILLILFFLLCLSFSRGSLPAQEFGVYHTERLSNEGYRDARERLRTLMPDSSVAVIFATDRKHRNNDVDYLFRQESNFLYLTGHLEPDAILVLFSSPFILTWRPDSLHEKTDTLTEVLFLLPRDRSEEVWNGRRVGAADAPTALGIRTAYTVSAFEAFWQRVADALTEAQPTQLRTLFVHQPSVYGTRKDEIASTLLRRFTSVLDADTVRYSKRTVRSLTPLLSSLRITKTQEEIAVLRRVTDISAKAHREAMRSCKPGMYEYHLAALAEYVFKISGCSYTGYPSIVGAGENSTILHYQTLRKRLENGELVVMDMAGEYCGYASDITRTIPVSGVFSKEQRAIYDVVLAANEAAIAECRPGISFLAPHHTAMTILSDGLKRLGILGEKDDYRRYTLHFISHHVGLDVHDPSSSQLQANQVITIEPGIYIPRGAPCDPKWWNIGIRIEDVVLITENGREVLSKEAPKKPKDIEALMKEKGVFEVRIR